MIKRAQRVQRGGEMEELKKIEIDEEDIGVLCLVHAFFVRMYTDRDVDAEIIALHGEDCLNNLDYFFQKHNIPREYALKCLLNNIKGRCGGKSGERIAELCNKLEKTLGH